MLPDPVLDSLAVCGPLVYTTYAIDAFEVSEAPLDHSRGSILSIETSDEDLPDHRTPPEPADEYVKEYLIDQSTSFLYYPSVRTYTKQTSFNIRDDCFGMTYTDMKINIDNFDSIAVKYGYSLT